MSLITIRAARTGALLTEKAAAAARLARRTAYIILAYVYVSKAC